MNCNSYAKNLGDLKIDPDRVVVGSDAGNLVDLDATCDWLQPVRVGKSIKRSDRPPDMKSLSGSQDLKMPCKPPQAFLGRPFIEIAANQSWQMCETVQSGVQGIKLLSSGTTQ